MVRTIPAPYLPLGPSQQYVDPGLKGTLGDCENLWLVHSASVQDAGDPAILDPDGSASAPGAFGGPEAMGYADADDDGFLGLDDCDDRDETVFPGASDSWYDGTDQDCDGANDFDQDEDGAELFDDCDDTDAGVGPGITEVPYDGIDNDCIGGDLVDVDGDGHAGPSAGGDDCDDQDPGISPSATEIWYDGIDQDCDGASDYDQDGDGVEMDRDCDDTDSGLTDCSDPEDTGSERTDGTEDTDAPSDPDDGADPSDEARPGTTGGCSHTGGSASLLMSLLVLGMAFGRTRA